ncbi:peptide deformylase [Patescibacteria group bacterium]|nr:peptide deformylase [Patescibacteria group bacterium]
MILQIQKGKDNPILLKKSEAIKKIDQNILELIENMTETMIKNQGIGLAASQVGKNIRLFILPKGLIKNYIFINPKILKMSKKMETIEEGCLSLPGIEIKIQRPESIKIKATDEKNKQFKLKLKGLPARIFQHEIDHLNGKLIQ